MEPETIIKQALSGKYKILEVIGKGGMATVYKAIQTNLNRPVALKVIHQNMVHDEEFIKRFKREAQVCSSINHSNIVTVYDVGSVGTVHFMSMEYLEGMTLRDFIKAKGPLDPDETVRYLSPVADVLGILHKKGIVHRDVKSSNIFITNNGRAVLMDFGVVFTEGREPLSITGSILGTPEYMSPEQAEGRLKVDGRSDIYSLGVIIFECITGQLPFQSDNYITTLYNVLNQQPPTITSINPKVPKWLSSIVASCLQKDRDMRIQDGFSLAKSLRNKEKLKVIANNGDSEKLTRKLFTKDIAKPLQTAAEIKNPKSLTGRDAFLKSLILITTVVILILIWIKFGTGHSRAGNQVDFPVKTISDSSSNQFKKSTDSTQIPLVALQNNNADLGLNGMKEKVKSGSETDINEEIRKYIDAGDGMQEDGLFEEAIKQYRRALRLDSRSTVLSQRINETAKKWRESIIGSGDAYLRDNNYDSAINIYTAWRQFEKDDNTINARLKRAISEKEEYKKSLSLNASIAATEDKLRQFGITMIRVESKALGNFYLGETEVTQQLWENIMGTNPSQIKGKALPVENVSYNEIEIFLSRLNQNLELQFRLPTEKEWEWAASGGDRSQGFKYSGSNQLSAVAWYINNSGNLTHNVKALSCNELGFYDMSGNVWEWCSTGVIGNKVIKGGSWLSTNIACAINYKQSMSSDNKNNTTGLRLCRSE